MRLAGDLGIRLCLRVSRLAWSGLALGLGLGSVGFAFGWACSGAGFAARAAGEEVEPFHFGRLDEQDAEEDHAEGQQLGAADRLAYEDPAGDHRYDRIDIGVRADDGRRLYPHEEHEREEGDEGPHDEQPRQPGPGGAGDL